MSEGVYKGVILIGGPQKGTRFRPLSLESPKPLFPIAGFPTIQHHIERLRQVEGLKEILLIGFFPQSDITPFIAHIKQTFHVSIRYLQEFTALGTAGGLYHFRDQILMGDPEGVFVINADVCGDLPLQEMVEFRRNSASKASLLMLSTEATRDQSMNYGCLVIDQQISEVLHYVEKPTTFVSAMINCGIYLITPALFDVLAKSFRENIQKNSSFHDDFPESCESLWFEKHVFPQLTSSGSFYAFRTKKWWSQIKTAAAAIYANRHCLQLYRNTHPERLAKEKEEGPRIIEDVYIHESAIVDPTAVIGPNVSIGANAVVGPGVRIRESIILENAILQDHSCILHCIIGWNSVVGNWARVEGTPIGPNPNMPFAKLESKPLFNSDGRLNPAITILGCNVQIPRECIVLNSIVLPHKELRGSFKNQIIL